MPLNTLKTYQAEKRKPLIELVSKAYQIANKEDGSLDEFELIKQLGYIAEPSSNTFLQAKKYQRFQFNLPALPEWNEALAEGDDQYFLQKLFETVFENKAEEVYKKIRKEHPDGVECWVNPHNASKHPLIENHFATSADSLFLAAQSILNENSAITAEDKALVLENLQIIRNRLDTSIQKLYDQTQLDDTYLKKSRLARLFSRKPKSPFEKQFEHVEKELLIFQRYTIAQLTQFEKDSFKIPHKKDFKRMSKRLACAEQQIKLHNNNLSNEAKQFNQDIFALHIDSEDNKTFQYHDRHYYLMESQKLQLEIKDDQKIATATAHNPEYLLSNYTMVEEGTVSRDAEETQVNIDHIGIRNGSHSPSELHKGRYQQYNKHLAAYHALNNMEQTQIAIRVKRIESLLSKVIPDAVKRIEISEKIALAISQQVHAKHIHDTGFTLDEVIDESLKEIDGIVEYKVAIKNTLIGKQEQLLNPLNYHTHLITAPGLGGVSEDQRHQFYSARLAQYATQDEKGGVFYLSNGVNTMRWDSFFFDANDRRVKGNNAVAMVEIFNFLLRSEKVIDDINQHKLESYQQLQDSVRNNSKAYFRLLEENYLPQKKRIEKTISEVSNLKKVKDDLIREREIKKNDANKMNLNSRIEETNQELTSKKTNLKNQKSFLSAYKRDLDTLRTDIDSAESQLHSTACQINKDIYSGIKAKTGLTGQWAIYQICQELFSGTNFAGIDNWKLTSNNGMFQALIQLITDDTDLFASSGCKSANDRELFVALLLTELIKEKKTCEKGNQIFNLEYFNANKIKIRDNALKQLHTHISNHQTQKDRSALPKTNDSILVNGNKALKSDLKNKEDPQNYASLSERLKIAKLAVYKRQRKATKDIDIQKMHYYGTHLANPNSATCLPTLLRKRWGQRPEGKKEKAITRYINHTFMIAARTETSNQYGEFLKQLNIRHPNDQRVLKNWLILHQYSAECLNKSENNNQYLSKLFKTNIRKIAEGIKDVTGNYGKGFKQMKQLLKDYNDEKEYSIQELVSILMTLQEIALPRTNDWTSRLQSRFFRPVANNRPDCLKELYQSIADMACEGNSKAFFISIRDDLDFSSLRNPKVKNSA